MASAAHDSLVFLMMGWFQAMWEASKVRWAFWPSLVTGTDTGSYSHRCHPEQHLGPSNLPIIIVITFLILFLVSALLDMIVGEDKRGSRVTILG